MVHNDEKGSWPSGKPWSTAEELRIGAESGDGPDAFGGIVALKVDPLGRMWVADGQANEIRVFDTEGKHVRSIGRKGGGPGEFAQLSGMDWDREGNMWVLDGVNARYTVLDTAGRVLMTRPRRTEMTITPWPGGFDRQGNLYDLAAVRSANGETRAAIVRFDSTLKAQDTLALPEEHGEFFELVSRDGLNRNRVNVPFTPTQVWRLDPQSGDVWLANTAAFSFIRRRMSGDTVQIVEREHTPIQITSDEMDRMLENFQWFTDMGGKIDRSRIPSTKPAFVSMFVDDRDYLWVIPEKGAEEQPGFDVFQPDGRYLGRVRSATRVRSAPAPVIRGDYLYATSADSSGVDYVVRLRVHGR